VTVRWTPTRPQPRRDESVDPRFTLPPGPGARVDPRHTLPARPGRDVDPRSTLPQRPHQDTGAPGERASTPTLRERLELARRDAAVDLRRDPRQADAARTAARLRSAADPGASLTRARLERLEAASRPQLEKVPAEGTTRPAGEPYAPLSEEAFAEVLARGNTDLHALDEVDNFRQTLPPAQQAEYDRMLESLRQDPRIAFEDEPGVTSTPAERDLMLRGIAAASFNNPKGLEATLAKASEGDGQFTLRAFDGPVPIDRFYGSGDTAAGLALPEGGVAIDLNFMRDATRRGDNPLLHEFSHVQQAKLGEDGKLVYSERFPADFPFGDAVAQHLEDPGFQAFLEETGYGADGIETWPTIQNLFHQFPEQLREASPEIYESMVKYQGFDPLTRGTVPPVRLGGDGSLAQAVPALSEHFESIAGEDGRITEGDLTRVAEDPTADPELRAAAQFLLASETGRNFLDVAAGRGDVDGRISARDLLGAQRWLAEHGSDLERPSRRLEAEAPAAFAAAVFDKYQDLFDTAAGKGGRDGHVSRGDLEAVVADGALPEHVRRAAQYLLAHPALLAQLDAR
jgi:hypothetical protein